MSQLPRSHQPRLSHAPHRLDPGPAELCVICQSTQQSAQGQRNGAGSQYSESRPSNKTVLLERLSTSIHERYSRGGASETAQLHLAIYNLMKHSQIGKLHVRWRVEVPASQPGGEVAARIGQRVALARNPACRHMRNSWSSILQLQLHALRERLLPQLREGPAKGRLIRRKALPADSPFESHAGPGFRQPEATLYQGCFDQIAQGRDLKVIQPLLSRPKQRGYGHEVVPGVVGLAVASAAHKLVDQLAQKVRQNT